MQHIITVIHRVTPLRNSAVGNPAHMLHTSAGDYRTGTDSACAYGAANPENMEPNEVRLTLSKGRVTRIESLGEPAIASEPTYGKGAYNASRAKMNQQAAARRVSAKAGA